MRAPRSIPVLASLALVSVSLGAVASLASAVGPVTVQYPSFDCPDTGDEGLQQCIDDVEAGSTIVLVSEIINEDADITKDLTLRAADQALQPLMRRLGIRTTGTDPLRVTVQDIRFEDLVQVRLSEGSGHDVRLRRLGVGKGSTGTRGLYVSAEVPASVTVEGSYIRRSDGDSHPALNLSASHPDGDVHFRAIGNRISHRSNPDSGGGIGLNMRGGGSIRADLMNNTIWDVARCYCGAESGIAVLPDGPIQADVNIVGNTIERSRTNGIQQRNDLTGSGHLRLDVFNNIFSHTQNPALDLDSGAPGSLTFRAGNNDFFANVFPNSLDGQSAGSGNQHANPKFVDRAAGNLKLKASSPLIDKGLVCSPGGIANLDAAGHGRLRGSSVDMGAYELDAGSPTGKALVGDGGDNALDGTSGDDILCGYAGDDTLRGKGGRDYLDGGSNDDRLTAGSGPDRSYGRGGKDTVCSNDGVHGNDRADGGSGSDKGRTDSGDIRLSIEASAPC